MTPYDTILHSPSGKLIHSSNTLALQFKMAVSQVHTLLIRVRRPTFAASIPYTICYVLHSYSTLLFSEITPPLWGVHKFHPSAEIWLYWFYNILLINIPLLSDSIQSIDQMFHLLHTCPCYQTLHYYYRKYPTSLCKSIHSIYQLQSDSIDFTLSFRESSPCWVITYNLSISCFVHIWFVLRHFFPWSYFQ